MAAQSALCSAALSFTELFSEYYMNYYHLLGWSIIFWLDKQHHHGDAVSLQKAYIYRYS